MTAIAETAPSLELVEDFSMIELTDLPLPLWVYVAGGLAIILIVLLISLLRKKGSKAKIQNFEEVAYQQAKERLGSISEMSIRPLATEISIILRSYFQMAAEDTALFETREEFERNEDRLSSLSDELRSEVEVFLRVLAALKYGEHLSQDADAKDLLSRAKNLLISARSAK